MYKIILNSTYGLSIEPNSFLYDPQFGMQITINGQMLLSMLYEMLSEAIPGSIPLMQNTDGLEMMIPKEHKQTYLDVCKKWETLTKLELEHDQYKKMIIRDVNNYIAIYSDPSKKPKCKGSFEFEDIALHKNKSFLIIRKAIYNYFVKGIPVSTTLAENQNIFDYCAGVKIKGDWKFQQTCGDEVKDLQKTLRYYVSNDGCNIVKVNKIDGRIISLEARKEGVWLLKDYNVATKKKWEDYDIDYEYYLFYINKEIENIIPPIKEKQQLEIEFENE